MMDVITTQEGDLSRRRRVSIEKLISAIGVMVATGIGLASAFGLIDPEQAQRYTDGSAQVVAHVASAINANWPLLSMLGALWWRRRTKEDR